MNLKNALVPITQFGGRQLLKVKAKSPTLLLVLGITGVVGGVVLACRATLKVEEIIDEAKDEIENVKNGGTGYEGEDLPPYSRKDLARVYGKTTFQFAKLYGPSILVLGGSIAAIIGSHGILMRRNASLMAAYGALDEAFKAYRERVKTAVGEDKERDIFTGATDLIVGEGKDKEVIKDISGKKHSPYARVFKEGTSRQWTKNDEANLVFLRCQQSVANQLLKTNGHLFLNEVYDMLGFERTQAGQLVGWVVNNEKGNGFVNFDIYDMYSQIREEGASGYERVVFLDFNVDGVIYDLI